MARNGAAPPNKKKDRNDAVIASIRAGMSAAQVARTLGISRQRVSQIWHSRDGDRTNLHGVKRRKRLAEQLARENASRSVPYGG